MRNLLLLTLDFPPRLGGVARYLEAGARIFHDRIFVVAPPEPESEAFDKGASYPVERVPLFSSRLWPHWLPILSILWKKRKTYELTLTSHVLPVGTATWMLKPFTHRPYIVCVHGMDLGLVKQHPWKRVLAKRILRGARVVVANSQVLAQEVYQDFHVSSLVVYPTVHETLLPGVEALSRPQDGTTHFLTVARLVERKGHLRVLQALSVLRRSGVSFSYQIIGDGPFEKTIRESILQLGLDSMVTMRTKASDADVRDAYAASNVFVMPTVGGEADREGFGSVYLEAAAWGLPSIASALPGVNEAVFDGETGLLVPDGNADALVQALLRMITDESLCRTLGKAAQQRALAEFRPEEQWAKLEPYL
ncbi:MAG TPA: glycosyltransferase family 4 protein [Patescibacteria group bacterium]|nr:glycosyltransferase family 4 protein [Patescibacteria group bacterium]